MATMTNSFKAMQIFCEKFGVDNFYSITINKNQLTAQGHFNTAIVAQLEGFEMSVDKYGYITFTAEQKGYTINVVFTN